SNGYDHKKMAITARGAWICVQRHFNEMGIDSQSNPIVVFGIGDMSGDVFGNGLLRSRSVRLVAAFNHQHVFVDPNPDPEASFDERARLFALPRSGWNDYDAALISAGGGVFPRAQKSIAITPEMRERFGFELTACSPDELIHALFKSPVDLIFNGGIGTYVKATEESHFDVGDRTNDAVRVNAAELRAKVFGEGGNLGMTQAARIEFALAGGRVNTDFIDNAGGVDCSDHEVNLKILFNQMVALGQLTEEQRNRLLAEMTEDVATLVLTDSFRQSQALSIAQRHMRDRVSEYQRFIVRMETDQRLDRALEGVPSDEVLADRGTRGQSLTRPELAVLLAYSKTHIKEHLIKSTIHTDPEIAQTVFEEFPPLIRKRYGDAVRKHRLYREILATMLANDVVHHLGISSVVHLSDFVGAETDEIVRAYYGAAQCFGIREVFRRVEALERVDGETRLDMLLQLVQLARRSARWLLRHRRHALDIAELARQFATNIVQLDESRLALMGVSGRARRSEQIERWVKAGVPSALADVCGNAAALTTTLPVIDAAERHGAQVSAVAEIFGVLNATLGIDWLVDQLSRTAVSSLWQAMERDLLLDDLMMDHATLAARINADLVASGETVVDSAAIDRWIAGQPAFARTWCATIDNAQHATVQDFSLLSMTCRRLDELTKSLSPVPASGERRRI
ncbi:MAG TPA: NAD-glutamate dehydrogenase domain-containing protein, partial [Pseudomonadales bacterium]